jgi:tryptophan 2,3-dioxygenase
MRDLCSRWSAVLREADKTSELWMRLSQREVHAAIAHIAADEPQPAFKMLARVSKIPEQLVHAWDVLATAQAAFEAPSLYDEALRLLARRGFAVPARHTQRDWTQPYEASDAVKQAWLQVYRNPKVERVIGFKRGTGGTGGVSYLRKMLDVVLFPEIWRLRTDL